MLKRPWLFPVLIIIGGATIFRPGIEIGLTIKIAAFIVVVAAFNTFFFVMLKRTRQGQKRNPPQ